MILTSTDLLDPAGDISPEMFPEDTPETLNERLSGYLSRAEQMTAGSALTGTSLEAALRSYAYYLAFRAVHVRLSSMPATVTLVDAGGRTRTQAQIDTFAARAAEYLARFEALVPVLTVLTPVTPAESLHTGTRVSW